MDRVGKAYLKEKYHKPGNVFLGVVHPDAQPVSVVLRSARTSKAAARLSEQFRDKLVAKVYWAVLEERPGVKRLPPCPPAGTLEAGLVRDPVRGVVKVSHPDEPMAKQALLHFVTKAEHDGLTLLEDCRQTGRTHQLPVQLYSGG